MELSLLCGHFPRNEGDVEGLLGGLDVLLVRVLGEMVCNSSDVP
jgi:hypothetical protein